MRLMIVGSDKIYAIENFYVKYLREQNVEVELFTAQNYFYDYYQKSVINKLIYRLGLSGIISKINRLFKKAVTKFRPDLIWVFKGMELTAASIEWSKHEGIKILNYNPDNPFIFSGRGSGNQHVIDAIPLYDLHFTYNREIKDKLEKEFRVRTSYLPFGFDIPDGLYDLCAAQPEIMKVCFAGNPDIQRAAFINRMAGLGLTIDVFGNDWGRYVSSPLVTVHAPVYGKEFWKVLRRYRVQLNLMRPHNEDSHNMRSFEIPGIGGIMLAPATTEHQLFFEDGREAFLFSDVENAIVLARKLLALSKDEADRIRNSARRRSLDSGYDYRARSATVLREIKALTV